MTKVTESSTYNLLSSELKNIFSPALGRKVTVEILIPAAVPGGSHLRLLVLNDGQDNPSVGVGQTYSKLLEANAVNQVVIVAVHAADRLQEYGLEGRLDYLKRGGRSTAYAHFITQELFPYLMHTYPISLQPEHRAVAGYSLGGLSALSLAWHYPQIFGKVGVFSGSLWWRSRDSNHRFFNEKTDRLAHSMIRKGRLRPGMQFWFQTGSNDETSDRNKNGVIDSIDDTLDLIVELTKKGYRPYRDIVYFEMEGGEHNPRTWRKAFPQFLKWAFPSDSPI